MAELNGHRDALQREAGAVVKAKAEAWGTLNQHEHPTIDADAAEMHSDLSLKVDKLADPTAADPAGFQNDQSNGGEDKANTMRDILTVLQEPFASVRKASHGDTQSQARTIASGIAI